MKRIKGFMALMITMMMIAGMGVFAAQGDDVQSGTGTITVKNAKDKVIIFTQDNTGDYKLDDAGVYVKLTDEEKATIDGSNRYKMSEEENAYKAYRIFQASPAGDGNDTSAPNSQWNGSDGNTVGYTATEAQYLALKDAKGVGDHSNTNLFVFSPAGDDQYVVSLTQGITAEDVAHYFNSLASSTINTSIFPEYSMTITDGSAVTDTAVPFGYYFVKSSQGVVVSVDTTNRDVHVYDKNVYSSPFNPGTDDVPDEGEYLKKVIKVNDDEDDSRVGDGHNTVTANIGDILTYNVTFNTSNYVVKKVDNFDETKKVSFVYINDSIGAGLDYALNDSDNPLKVEVSGKSDPLSASQSSFSTQESAGSPKYYLKGADNASPRAFTIVIPWLDEQGNPVFDNDAVVKVTYSAKVNSDVGEVEGTTPAENSVNKAGIKYDIVAPDEIPKNEGTGSETAIGEDEVRTAVYALGIQKYDGRTMRPLSNAHFKVEVKGMDANQNETWTEIGAVYDSSLERYNFDSTHTATAAEKDFESNSDGQIIIYGLAAGDYRFTETSAPGGYNLMTGTTTVSPSVASVTSNVITTTTTFRFVNAEDGMFVFDTDHYRIYNTAMDYGLQRVKLDSTRVDGNEKTVTYYTNENVVSAAILNNTGRELPSTGGMGTKVFYIVGGLLIAASLVLMFLRHRHELRGQ